MTFDLICGNINKQNVMSNLEEWCGRGTEGIICIIERLRELCI